MDTKTMAEGSKSVGRDVPIARDTDNPSVPGDFHEFSGSQSKMYVTFDNRAEKVAAALGNKAPLVS